MEFTNAVLTSDGQDLMAQAASSNHRIVFVKMLSSTSYMDAATLKNVQKSSLTGPNGTYKHASATNNVVRVMAEFTNQATAVSVKTVAITARLANQSDAQAIVMMAQSIQNSSIYIPSTSELATSIQIAFNLAIGENGDLFEINSAANVSIGDFERLRERTVTTHADGDVTDGDDQVIRGVKRFADGVFLVDTSGSNAGAIFGNIDPTTNAQQVTINTHIANVEIIMRDNDDDTRDMTLVVSDSSIRLKEDIISILAGNGNVSLTLNNDEDEINFSLQAGKSITVYDLANDQQVLSLDVNANDRLLDLDLFKRARIYLTNQADGDNYDGQFIVSEHLNDNYIILASPTHCRLWPRADENNDGAFSVTEVGAEFHGAGGNFTTSIVLKSHTSSGGVDDIGTITLTCDEGNGTTRTKAVLDADGITLTGTDSPRIKAPSVEANWFRGELSGLYPRAGRTAQNAIDFPLGAICVAQIGNTTGNTLNLHVGDKILFISSSGVTVKTSNLSNNADETLPHGEYVMLSTLLNFATNAFGMALVMRVS